jgi:hypothetical protein
MDPETPKATLAAYYQSVWEKLVTKADVFAPENPLGEWREMVQKLYALELRLPKQKAAGKASGVQLTVSGVLSVVGRAKEFYGVISCWSDW